MNLESLESIRAIAYFVATILLVIFLYTYIVSMYVKQKKGIVDYERYADLALKDNLDDELIEPRENKQNN
ncbi:cytochrome c oxidase, cbb3-type, CcoQ subunit [Helicobacter cappadocius]|uniref:Cytochrome c oxidase, cbb3-type, CcoQ subunit n=1 Tax=Helicobacter cappadocius TaxID=3063998 RepID=A0AA90PH95_9HELI|nr:MULTISPECIES: cytochrome c oxidase, cbb3-type, CcoQ subunit [unclassified Helicobacter]MDO7252425.1 cytochrome c oxidase, cbb3-type, CcoQ subunit [Helicobacter sp. faydin-H75]MDP2538292.1 cytochrome c oxidase, cbb3-type, CcoQ subunit [Helicobacter sp. faydin-H76]